ncbi:MAG TPA: DEAD/DEAH box helicase family protein [Mycobacteriales bacterium]|nr:DEAD/DEAH box helicase family protein [Mycobacteriales bacterium]
MGEAVSSGSVDILPEPTPPRRGRKPKPTGTPADAGAPASAPSPAEPAEPPAEPAAAAAAAVAPPPITPPPPPAPNPTPAPAVPPAVTTPAMPAEGPAATPTSARADQASKPAPTTPGKPMPGDPFKPSPVVDTVEPATPADVYPPSPAPGEAGTPPNLTGTPQQPPGGEATGGADNAAGVRALQEAFAIDIAEREERHRAEVRAMQQSFMTDVAAREDRHRAEVQALHQRFTAEATAREDRQRAEVSEIQQQLGNVRAQLGEATAARDRETEGRAVAEAEIERLRDEIQIQRNDISRLNNARADLQSQLAASKQETEKWSEQARRVEVELRTARADADKAAANAARQYEEKVRDLEETTRKLDETTRSLATSEERVARLTDQAAALDAASAQLRQTIAEQRAERERVTTERDAVRQQAAELEAQLRKVEFEAEQADEDGARQLDEAARKIEAAEEQAARAVGQVAVHEATIEELRRAAADMQIELKKASVDRDAAKRRIQSLEAELSLLDSSTTDAEEKPAAPGDGEAADADTDTDTTAEADDEPVATTAPAVEAATPAGNEDDRPLALSADIELVAWQREALAAWTKTGRRGVVEAVSGAGKTDLAYWAIAAAVDEGMKVLVITSSGEQVDRWYDGLRAALPINRVGKPTGAKDESLQSFDVVVSTAQDATKDNVFGTSFKGMLVADQVHTLGTREASRALDPVYAWRLGLSAAYHRDDSGIATYLEPYFGKVSFTLGYARALKDDVIAPFDVAVVPVTLNNAEQAEYDALGQQMDTLADEMVKDFAVPAEPASAFAAAVVTLADGRMGPPRTAARAYQKALAKREEIMSRAAGKAVVLKALADHVRAGEPALVFVQNQDDATYVAKLLNTAGCPTRSLSGGTERKLLGRRSDGGQEADDIVLLAGAGGADAATHLGIVVGASRDKLQLIQRLGQVVRKADDERPGRLVVVYVEGTPEDTYSADTAPLATVVTPNASRQQRFGASEAGALIEFLAPATNTPATEDAEESPAES